MTADIRTAAEEEAIERWPRQDPSIWHDADLNNFKNRSAFADGAVWAAARVTPTRRQLLDVIAPEFHEGDPQGAADAVLALMQGLAEGES